MPHRTATSAAVCSQDLVLSVGDTSFLDYSQIKIKRDGYGPQSKGGNGLLLHSALAVDPHQGQPLGPPVAKSCGIVNIIPSHLLMKRQSKRSSVERSHEKQQERDLLSKKNLIAGSKPSPPSSHKFPQRPRVIHIFDREGDIAEVFAQLSDLTHTGVVVRASHNRVLNPDSQKLWSTIEAEAIQGYLELELPATQKRTAHKAKLAIQFCPVQLRAPERLQLTESLSIYAVYVNEVDCPEEDEPVSWMLLTSEKVETVDRAITIVRWYSYRWRVEMRQPQYPHSCFHLYAEVT